MILAVHTSLDIYIFYVPFVPKRFWMYKHVCPSSYSKNSIISMVYMSLSVHMGSSKWTCAGLPISVHPQVFLQA
jgi:hypothetical protein